jgi:hypothetical protein
MIEFALPSVETICLKKVVYMPTNPLRSKNSGQGYDCGDEWLMITNIGNITNQNHEFFHSVVNPIMMEVVEKLSGEQMQKVLDMASGNLKGSYGRNPEVLLGEEFIRAYTDTNLLREPILSYEAAEKQLDTISEEDFLMALAMRRDIRDTCERLGIVSLVDLRDNIEKRRAFFEARFSERRSPLKQLAYEMLTAYRDRSNKMVNLKAFLLDALPKRL